MIFWFTTLASVVSRLLLLATMNDLPVDQLRKVYLDNKRLVAELRAREAEAVRIMEAAGVLLESMGEKPKDSNPSAKPLMFSGREGSIPSAIYTVLSKNPGIPYTPNELLDMVQPLIDTKDPNMESIRMAARRLVAKGKITKKGDGYLIEQTP